MSSDPADDGDGDGLGALLERPFDAEEWDLFTTFLDVPSPTIDQVLRGVDPRLNVPATPAGQPSPRPADEPPPIGQVDAFPHRPDNRAPRHLQQAGAAPAKQSARQAGLDSAPASSDPDGPPSGKRRTTGSGSPAPASAHHVLAHEQPSPPPDLSTTSTTNPLPPSPDDPDGPVDPDDPTPAMVVTRTVDHNGCVSLGMIKEGDAGQARKRLLHVGSSLRGQRVDVRFDRGRPSVIAKDHNGRDTVVPLANREKWTLTGEEFSRLRKAPKTAAPLPPPMINPAQPMVITRTADSGGRVYLGFTKEGGAGQARKRYLHVGSSLRGQQVDVRFDHGKLYIIAKNPDGHYTVRVADCEKWMTGEEFSRLHEARNTTAPLPPPMINPAQPMVITRTVGMYGYVLLGMSTEGGDAGKVRKRYLHVGSSLRGQQVDVRFDHGKLYIIAKNPGGHYTVIEVTNRREWMTGEEFSWLLGVRNTDVAEAPRPAVPGAAEGHTGVTVGSDPSEEGEHHDRRPANGHDAPAHPAGNSLGGGHERDNDVAVAFRRIARTP